VSMSLESALSNILTLLAYLVLTCFAIISL
jgi:hypothetical protein